VINVANSRNVFYTLKYIVMDEPSISFQKWGGSITSNKACLLARITIIAFDGSRIFVPLAVMVRANWLKGQVVVGCIYSRISTSKLNKFPGYKNIRDMY
jgi:hypothetical protein